MLKIKALPLSVDLLPGESATSLASRLAQRNGAHRLITFCSDIGLDYFALANGDVVEVARLAAFADVDAKILLRHTPSLVRKDWFKLGEAEIKFSAFQRTKPRVCPICIGSSKDGVRSSSLCQTGSAQLTSMRVCTTHNCLLGALPRPASNKDHFDIAQLAEAFEPYYPIDVEQRHLGLIDHIGGRLAGEITDSWFDQLPFHVATQACENFGLLLLQGPQAKRQFVSELDWVNAGHIGYSYLREGAEALITKLAELERDRPNDNSLYRGRFGVFFEWLRNRDDDAAFDAIRDPVRDFIFETYPIPKGALVLGIENPKRRFHTHRTLSKERRLDFTKTGHALLQRGYVQKSESNSFELLRYVPSDVADDVAHELNRVFTVSHTAKKLGLTRATIDQLLANGLISPHFKHRGAVPGFHSDEIWRFATSATQGWEPSIRNKPAKNWVSFQDAARRCKCATWQVLAMVIHYRLPVTNPQRSKKRLSDHITCPRTLARKFDEIEAASLSFVKAGTMLGCGATEIEELVCRGLLSETPLFVRRSKRKHRTVYLDGVKSLAEPAPQT